jgi:hypothetical protein
MDGELVADNGPKETFFIHELLGKPQLVAVLPGHLLGIVKGFG